MADIFNLRGMNGPTAGTETPSHTRILVLALTAAVMISFSAIFFALSDVEPVTGAFFRSAYALPVLVLLWWLGRKDDHRPRQRRLLALVAGLMLGVDVVLWHTAINYVGTGLATLIANTQVIFVALGAWLIQGERPSTKIMFAVPVVLFGVGMVSGVGQEGAYGTNPLLGAVLAVVAAVFYAAFILGYRASNQSLAPPAGPLMEATFGAMLTALALSSFIGPGLDLVPTWPGHLWLIALALMAQVVGWLLLGYVLPRLPAVETATIILIQPVLTMIWGAIIFGESPSVVQLIGAAIVLGGVATVAWSRARADATVPSSVTTAGG